MDEKPAPEKKTTARSCWRWKNRKKKCRPSCCRGHWRWNFLVRRRNSAAREVERNCAEVETKRCASPAGLREHAAGLRQLLPKWRCPKSVPGGGEFPFRPGKMKPRKNLNLRSGVRSDHKRWKNSFRASRRCFQIWLPSLFLIRAKAVRWPPGRRSDPRAEATSRLAIFGRARWG
jgi:hypothetical protein